MIFSSVSYAQNKSTTYDYHKNLSHAWAMFNYNSINLGFEMTKINFPIFPDTITVMYDKNDTLIRPKSFGVGAVLDFNSPKLAEAPANLSELSFMLDTIVIDADYIRVNDVVDTLILEVVFGNLDTNKLTNTEFFPMSFKTTPSFKSFYAPRYNPYPVNELAGVSRKIYKLYLTNNDTVTGNLENKNLSFKFALENGAGLSIPGDNIVGAYISYKPGNTYSLNDVIMAELGSSHTQVLNSFSPNFLIPTLNNDDNTANDIPLAFFDDESFGLSYRLFADAYYNAYDTTALSVNWNKALSPDLDKACLISFIVSGNFKTGIKNNNLDNKTSVNVYPNPAINTINISTKEKSSVDFKLYDITGKCMINKNNQNLNGTLKVDVSNMANGVYFYNILIDGKQNVSDKIIINK
ncbi:MAG: hypothetical protein A2X12_08910 [Bacteroidetes bacterium GWE2_29_8]|nr:MAG: hypothetical protein A2X12_08910 [Bacteroidetes bacterium GWE2_29_8]OFY23326.1 MAG: hypothetical protein A2X02_08645 [Bacteroidetes bacterium GWF2_29_10]